MLNNTKYILINFVTLNKKVMKQLLFILVLFVAFNAISQPMPFTEFKGWERTSFKEKPEIVVDLAILCGTFMINEYTIHSPGFDYMTMQQKNDITRNIYFTGVSTMLVSHFVIEYCREHKVFKKLKRKLKYSKLW